LAREAGKLKEIRFMIFDSKSLFNRFMKNNLTMENSQEIYDVFYLLEDGEEILFKNCCNILGIDRDKFIKSFIGTEIYDIDEDAGLTAIAAAEKFGTIVYENPDEPSYGTIKEMLFDNSNVEYMKFRQELFYSAVCDIVDSYDESKYHFTHVLSVIEKMGVFKEKKHNMENGSCDYKEDIGGEQDNGGYGCESDEDEYEQ